MRNQSHGWIRSVDEASPAIVNTSPSPVASMTYEARTAWRPAFDVKTTCVTAPPSTMTSLAHRWYMRRTLASAIHELATNLNSSGSYATE